MPAPYSRLKPLLGVVLAISLTACPEPPPEVEVVIRPVRYVVAQSTAESATRTFSGVASSGLESSLSFRVSGNIETIAVTVGDSVSEGDLIAQLDTSDYEVQRQQASADSSAARAFQRNAEADYERIRSLYESGAASRSDLDAARANADSSRAQVSAARQRVRQADDLIEYCTLNAPQDGQIAEVPVEVNENVSAGQAVVVITSTAEEQLEVDVDIPETAIARIRRGMTGAVTFDAMPNRFFSASVTEVGVRMGAATFPVTLLLDELDPDIRPGMAANVTFTFGEVDDTPRFWLPAVAVGEDQDGRFVFVLDATEQVGVYQARRQRVRVGQLDNRGLEVLEGVSDSDRIVTAGVSRLVEGQQVRLLQGPAPSGLGEGTGRDELLDEAPAELIPGGASPSDDPANDGTPSEGE